MRISDWSSDVCSSDLVAGARRPGMNIAPLRSSIAGLAALRPLDAAETGGERGEDRIKVVDGFLVAADHHAIAALQAPRSEERRGGQACVSTCISRWAPSH